MEFFLTSFFACVVKFRSNYSSSAHFLSVHIDRPTLLSLLIVKSYSRFWMIWFLVLEFCFPAIKKNE